MKNRVIVAGGRDFKDYWFLEEKLDLILSNLDEIEIISGGQVSTDGKERWGADYFGELYANKRGYPVKKFLANWDKYGKAAGPKRNKEMAEYATHLVAFPGGKGTKNMIEEAKKMNLKIRIL